MTPQQVRRASRVLTDLEKATGAHRKKLIEELRGLIEPTLTLREIFARIPGDDVTAKAATIGITRQAYYKLISGKVRAQDGTAQLLAKAAGVPIEVIRAARP